MPCCASSSSYHMFTPFPDCTTRPCGDVAQPVPSGGHTLMKLRDSVALRMCPTRVKPGCTGIEVPLIYPIETSRWGKEQLQCVEVGNTIQSIGKKERRPEPALQERSTWKRPSGKEVLEKDSHRVGDRWGAWNVLETKSGISRRCSTASAE